MYAVASNVRNVNSNGTLNNNTANNNNAVRPFRWNVRTSSDMYIMQKQCTTIKRAYNLSERINKLNNKEIITDFGYLYKAFLKSKNNRSYKKSAMYFQLNAVSEIRKLQNELKTDSYKVSGYTDFEVTHPKRREIKACKFRDKVVQHVLCDNIIVPMLADICIIDNYAGQKGKGTNFARERLRKKMNMFYFSNGMRGYFYRGDISKYYYSINHEKAIDIMEYYFPEDLHWIINEFIKSTDGDVGIALGNQINTAVSNLYLDGLDKFIIGELGIRYYGRYADDFYLIHESKEYVKYCEYCIKEYLNTLGLNLNPKSQIIPFKNGISFLGFHFYKEDIGFVVKLNNKKKRDYRRKFNKMYKKVKCGSLSFDKLEESYRSWKNHASFCTDKSIFVYYDTRMKALKKLKGGERKRGN